MRKSNDKVIEKTIPKKKGQTFLKYIQRHCNKNIKL